MQCSVPLQQQGPRVRWCNEPPGAGNDHRSRFKSRICAGTALQAAVILGAIDRSRFTTQTFRHKVCGVRLFEGVLIRSAANVAMTPPRC